MRYIKELEHKVQVLQSANRGYDTLSTVDNAAGLFCTVAGDFDSGSDCDGFKLTLLCLFAEGLSWTGYSEQRVENQAASNGATSAAERW